MLRRGTVPSAEDDIQSNYKSPMIADDASGMGRTDASQYISTPLSSCFASHSPLNYHRNHLRLQLPMAHPKTYKAFAFIEKGGALKPITFDWHNPGPGEVVVKVLACGVCAR